MYAHTAAMRKRQKEIFMCRTTSVDPRSQCDDVLQDITAHFSRTLVTTIIENMVSLHVHCVYQLEEKEDSSQC